MNSLKDRELLESLLKFVRGFRVGKDLELAEAALRRERVLRAELDRMPPAPAQLAKAA